MKIRVMDKSDVGLRKHYHLQDTHGRTVTINTKALKKLKTFAVE